MRDEVPLRSKWQWPPLAGRLPKTGSPAIVAEIEQRHYQAMIEGRSTYVDPMTGLVVFTALFLANRGYCCDSGCRHCPYEPLDPE